jgi:hypothetical protein
MGTPPIKAIDVVSGDESAVGLDHHNPALIESLQHHPLQTANFVEQSVQVLAVQNQTVLVVAPKLPHEVN